MYIEYRDDDDNIVGFDIDLAQYIADKLGVDMEVTDMEFSLLFLLSRMASMIFLSQQCYKTDEDARLWICPNPTATVV